MSGNNVDLVGNITREPELRFTPGGMPVATFGLAVNRKVNDEERTSFFDVVCFGSLAENVAESVDKGARVLVVGRLEQRSWETKDGDKRSKVEIVADEVGPSLRWARADVTKNDKREGSGASGGGAPKAKAYDADEEPF